MVGVKCLVVGPIAKKQIHLQPEVTFVEGTRTAMSEDVGHRVVFVGVPISPRSPRRTLKIM